MILNELQTKDFNMKLLEVFKNTSDFLNRHNLRWWVAYGTALGTIRHHGMIPWDDDIDIFMPYEDYCRLIKMDHEFDDTRLEIYRPFEGDYYLPFVKIGDRNSTISELARFRFVGGVWVDVFPLYKTDATPDEYMKCVKNVKRYLDRYQGGKMHFVLSDFVFYVKGFHLRSFKLWLLNLTIHKLMHQKIAKQFKQFVDSIHNPDGHFYMFPNTYMHSMTYFPIDWFRETREMDFEDFKVKMPIDYEKILNRLYGDYMTPPPPEKRKSTHAFYFVDLNKRYSYQEIKRLLE